MWCVKKQEKAKEPVLSFCIPNYHGRDRLRGLLKNVVDFCQKMPKSSLEIVVSDNGSNDGSSNIIFRYLSEAANHNVDFKINTFPKNQGYDKNIEAVLNLASGRLAWFMPVDFKFNEALAKEVIDAVEKHERVGCAVLLPPGHPAYKGFVETYKAFPVLFENEEIWDLLKENPEIVRKGVLPLYLVNPTCKPRLYNTLFGHWEAFWRALVKEQRLLVIPTKHEVTSIDDGPTRHMPWYVIEVFFLNKLRILDSVVGEENQDLGFYKKHMLNLAYKHYFKQVFCALLLKGYVDKQEFREGRSKFKNQLEDLLKYKEMLMFRRIVLWFAYFRYLAFSYVLPPKWSAVIQFLYSPVKDYVHRMAEAWNKRATWQQREEQS